MTKDQEDEYVRVHIPADGRWHEFEFPENVECEYVPHPTQRGIEDDIMLVRRAKAQT